MCGEGEDKCIQDFGGETRRNVLKTEECLRGKHWSGSLNKQDGRIWTELIWLGAWSSGGIFLVQLHERSISTSWATTRIFRRNMLPAIIQLHAYMKFPGFVFSLWYCENCRRVVLCRDVYPSKKLGPFSASKWAGRGFSLLNRQTCLYNPTALILLRPWWWKQNDMRKRYHLLNYYGWDLSSHSGNAEDSSLLGSDGVHWYIYRRFEGS